MDGRTVVDQVRKHDPQIFELFQATYFKGHRNMRDGAVHPVTVVVLEEHAGAGHKYHVTVTDDETGRFASGNAREDLADTLLGLHWWDLEPKP